MTSPEGLLVIKVALNPAEAGARYLMLKEPTGREELAFASGQSVTLAEALGQLVSVQLRMRLALFSLSNRDRILAAIFVSCFGDQVESILRCRSCNQSYEFGFSMGELVAEFDQQVQQAQAECQPMPGADGICTLAPGIRFRLPNIDDEIAASEQAVGAAAQLILDRCVVEGDPLEHAAAIDVAKQCIAPLVKTTLDSACPHCDSRQAVDFDLVDYFTRAFARERPLLTREIHCLASAYRFNYIEILEMPRSLRQELVALVLGQGERRSA